VQDVFSFHNKMLMAGTAKRDSVSLQPKPQSVTREGLIHGGYTQLFY